MSFLIKVLVLSLAAQTVGRGQEVFGGEVQRFKVTSSAATTVIELTGSIPSRSVGVLNVAIEAPSSMSLSSIADSRGNNWTLQASLLNNSVHQISVASANIVTALQAGDRITITFKGAVNSPRFGSLQYLSGCSSDDQPERIVVLHGYGSKVSGLAKTSPVNALVVGVIQVDQRNSPHYTAKDWTQVGPSDNYGQTGTKVGLQNIYLYKLSPANSTYQPDGEFRDKKSWSFISVAFDTNPEMH